MSDRRVWTPDETCDPFTLEAAPQNVNIPLLSFSVPNDCEAVIKSLWITEDAFAQYRKLNARVTIERGIKSISGVVPPGEGIKTTGGLSDITEWDIGATDKNVSGFIITMGGSSYRPCNVILPAGHYEFWFRGSTGAVIAISITGYTYPLNPDKRRV